MGQGGKKKARLPEKEPSVSKIGNRQNEKYCTLIEGGYTAQGTRGKGLKKGWNMKWWKKLQGKKGFPKKVRSGLNKKNPRENQQEKEWRLQEKKSFQTRKNPLKGGNVY